MGDWTDHQRAAAEIEAAESHLLDALDRGEEAEIVLAEEALAAVQRRVGRLRRPDAARGEEMGRCGSSC